MAAPSSGVLAPSSDNAAESARTESMRDSILSPPWARMRTVWPGLRVLTAASRGAWPQRSDTRTRVDNASASWVCRTNNLLQLMVLGTSEVASWHRCGLGGGAWRAAARPCVSALGAPRITIPKALRKNACGVGARRLTDRA